MGIRKTVYEPKNVKKDFALEMIFHGTSKGASAAQMTWPRTMLIHRGHRPLTSAPTGSELEPALVAIIARIMP
jgi:hypothetical protein